MIFVASYQINVEVSGTNINAHGILWKHGPEECHEVCQNMIGCAWFSWKKVSTENSGICKLYSMVKEFFSDNSTTGVISGPTKYKGSIRQMSLQHLNSSYSNLYLIFTNASMINITMPSRK